MLKVTHNAGFFSCCSVRLDKIVEFMNKNKVLPIVDSSEQFAWYKISPKDITYDYFEKVNESIPIHYINYEQNHQFSDYSKLDYTIVPVVQKYFSPSNQIRDIITHMERKYKLNYQNICVLFYRGNDKNRETKICGYDEYIRYAHEVLKTNPTIQFLLQSDETEFLETMTSLFPNSFYFKDEIRHMKKCDNTVDKVYRDSNHISSKFYLAITIIMSKCNYIVCSSGNCSIWIILYRGHCHNVYQYLENKFLCHK